MGVGTPFHTRPAETLLTARAVDFLSAGPADAATLIAHVCQLPGVPLSVAEHMARALFADRLEFSRDLAGRWTIAPERPVAPAATTEPAAPSIEAVAALPAVEPGLLSLSYAVVDVETTGTSPGAGDRITEIAVVVVRNGEVAERFETLVNPQRPIPPFITALTRITWDMVKDKPTFRDVCDDVLRAIDGRIFVAHNASFDWRFVEAEVARATGRRIGGERLCTVRMARRLLPNLRRRNLDSVADYFGVNVEARHRAGGDATATAHVLLHLLREARRRECASWASLQALLSATASTTRRRRRPGMPRPVEDDRSA